MNNGCTAVPSFRVLIFGPDPRFRGQIRALLQNEADFQLLGESGRVDETISLVTALKAEVLLVDLTTPRSSELEALWQLAAAPIFLRIVILAAHVDGEIFQAFRLGARAFVPKKDISKELTDSLRAVVTGEYWAGHARASGRREAIRQLRESVGAATRVQHFQLTPREQEIVALVAAARRNKDIAQKFAITEDTVKRHLTHIFDKLGVSSRLELALYAIRHAVAEPPSKSRNA